MRNGALEILWVTHAAPSPPRFGAARRMHGLMTGVARRNHVTAVSLVHPDEAGSVAEALRGYCRDAVVVPRSRAVSVAAKRGLQLRSLLAASSFERLYFGDPALLRAARRQLAERPFDVVAIECPFVFREELRRPRGGRRPALVLDAHNVEHDLVRQVAGGTGGVLRRAYSGLDWRKLRREEVLAWRRCDGVVLTSAVDERRVRATLPGAHTAVVPNAVDVAHFRRRDGDPPRDGRTLLFFGAIAYYPNTDGVLHFVREVWPALAARRPELRLKIVGPEPPPAVRACAGPRVEVTGFVDDLRPHLAGATVAIVPLRIGGGTRLKIVEAMAMGLPVVSTPLGAEGLDVRDGEELLLADGPAPFAAAVERLLDEPGLADRVAAAARACVEARYSWDASAATLEEFLRRLAPATG